MIEAIHNLAVTMGKKMDAIMSTLSEVKKKQDHLALALQQVSPPMPVTGGPRQLSARSLRCSTPARDTPWYKSDSFTDHTPKAGALFSKPAFKVTTTTCSEATFTLPSTVLAMPASKSTSTAPTEAASVTTATSTKAASKTTPAAVKTAKASRKKIDDDTQLLSQLIQVFYLTFAMSVPPDRILLQM